MVGTIFKSQVALINRAVTNVEWRQTPVKSSNLEGQITGAALEFYTLTLMLSLISNLISLRRWHCSLPSFFAKAQPELLHVLELETGRTTIFHQQHHP